MFGLLFKDMWPFLVHVNRAVDVTLVWLCCLYILKANIFSKIFRAEVVLYGLFALYALISGVFLAANTNLVLDKASTVLQLLSLIVATITIVYVSKEVKWNLYLLFFLLFCF